MNYDVLLFPRKRCKYCNSEFETKMNIDRKDNSIKFYNICLVCKTTSCDVLKHIETCKVDFTLEDKKESLEWGETVQ